MKNLAFLKIFFILLFFAPTIIYAIDPPKITATGNQIYCPGTSLNIVQTVNITFDSLEPTTDVVYIQISSGYLFGQDLLSLTGTNPGIGYSWVQSEGKLKLYSISGKLPYADFEAAIKKVTFTNSSSSPSGTRTFSISLGTGQLSYLPRNKHFYEYVANTGITWTNAKSAAETRPPYYGLKGYLATLTAADEAQLAGAQAPGAGWIGGSDSETEGTWKWVTGPEGLANGGTGTIFWYGTSTGYSPTPINFAFWNNGEPNDYSGANPDITSGDENYAHITKPKFINGVPDGNNGKWNDLPNTGDIATTSDYHPQGYIVEYGGLAAGDVDNIQISASTAITIGKIDSVSTTAPVCDNGTFTFQATAYGGPINWYDSLTGGNLVGTGTSFTTPMLTSTTFYYADAGCTIFQRTKFTATINTIPTITSTTPNFRCDSGTIPLTATASAGNVNWYDVTGNLLFTGTSFITPNISSTTTYYVDATASGCTSLTRTAITATVNNSPIITSTSPQTICDSGTATIGAVASAGNIRWYDKAAGGTLLFTGHSYTTLSISTTTTYYAEAFTATCTSITRTPVTATVYYTPTITSTSPASICDLGTATLAATASAGNIEWYDSAGNFLVPGNSFTTPIISATTTYYVDAIANGCTSPARTAITATVTTTPSVTSTTPDSRCDSGIVNLKATASAGNINWYDAAGNFLITGNTFTTPTLDSSTTYYVAAINSKCESPKTPITATVYPIDKTNEEVLLCQGKTVTLDASIPGMNYLWSPGGEIKQTILISTIGDYRVTISSPTIVSCDSQKNFSVIEHPKPVIKTILVHENTVTIELDKTENYYEYSINGVDFQVRNQFSYIPSGQYIAFVRDNNGCNIVKQAFTIFTIAKYFTPNNDGFNDAWKIEEMGDYPNSSAQIFDRLGKLITNLNSYKHSWDGKYNSNLLPADDYWYVLNLGNGKPEIKGHFTLKR